MLFYTDMKPMTMTFCLWYHYIKNLNILYNRKCIMKSTYSNKKISSKSLLEANKKNGGN